ncbi:hypothetical protein LXL04_026831 [Taraxacum kok-saghyz]
MGIQRVPRTRWGFLYPNPTGIWRGGGGDEFGVEGRVRVWVQQSPTLSAPVCIPSYLTVSSSLIFRSHSGLGFLSRPQSVSKQQLIPHRRRHGSYAQWRGISASAKPYKRTPPSWLKISSQDVEENICKFAKKGLTPSQIGVILRDSHGIAQVNSVTGSKILRILKGHGLAPEIPEDLYHLIKKAVAIRKHLERNRKDKDSKFRLILVESRIHRLARYYKKTKKLPPVWKYESTTASTLVA